MSEFRKFPSVPRLGHVDTDGIFDGPVMATVKLDGANASIWLDDNGVMQLGSRNQQLGPGESFRGFREWASGHEEAVRGVLGHYPGCNLFGEWLVPHKVKYEKAAYERFYVFGIRSPDGSVMYESLGAFSAALAVLSAHDLETTECVAWIDLSGPEGTQAAASEAAEALLNEKRLAPHHEGVVVTALGPHSSTSRRAKLVRRAFKEIAHQKTSFGSGDPIEAALAELFVTTARVEKAMERVASDRGAEYCVKFTGQALNYVHDDVLREEMLTLDRKARKSKRPFDFGEFKRVCDEVAKRELVGLGQL